jgi:formate dehydrogenase major subunit
LDPGYRSVDDRLNGDELSKLWGSDNLIPIEGLTMVEMFDSTVEGYVKGMYIMGENPMMSDPDIQHVEEELKNLEFLVVQDIFLTETAKLADVVLPSTSWAEKDGTFTNTERRVQYIRKAIEPIGDSRPDWEIICDIAKRMGSKLFEYSSTQEIFEEIRKVVPQYAGMNKKRLKRPEGLYWPCYDENHPGTPILHKEDFNTIDGLGTFYPKSFKESAQQTDDEYPFILTTGRMSFHWHTGTMSRRSKTLHNEAPTGYVEINTEDAEKLGIQNENLVKVSTVRGKIELPAHVTNNILEGVLFIPFHFVECAANVLTCADNLDPVSKIPELKISAANVEKV